MLTVFKSLVLAGYAVGAIAMGIAQADDSKADFEAAGKAYQYAGSTKYLIAPSKFIFGSGDLKGSAIVDGYHIDPASMRLPICFGERSDFIYLESVPGRWWQKPAYVLTPSLPSDSAFVVLPRDASDRIDSHDCPMEDFLVRQDKFLVDAHIVSALRSGASN